MVSSSPPTGMFCELTIAPAVAIAPRRPPVRSARSAWRRAATSWAAFAGAAVVVGRLVSWLARLRSGPALAGVEPADRAAVEPARIVVGDLARGQLGPQRLLAHSELADLDHDAIRALLVERGARLL